MPLIKSISGIRGTIGGQAGDNLTPIDVVSCTSGFGSWILKQGKGQTIIIGRDARISGSIVESLVVATLRSMGLNVINLGLSTTPTVEIAVMGENAAGGIILTASHNPKEWNALKFLNHRGEFISASAGAEILNIIDQGDTEFCSVQELGKLTHNEDYIMRHIDLITDLELVDASLIKSKHYRIVVDCVNSTGAISIKPLLERLGCSVLLINDEMTGDFAHNPEPLPKHLIGLSEILQEGNHDLGIAVDPDVDRLVFVCEDGSPFGEEYTIVAIADYILQVKEGNTVSNLSSTKALRDITEKHGSQYFAAAVGEVNVVEKMKSVEAIFGGEGNGGVIYPALHYGRDALVGIALFLTHLAKSGLQVSELRRGYPSYSISKQKVTLAKDDSPDLIIEQMALKYADLPNTTVDGLKLEMDDEWVHMRKSNTEPIIRIYAESMDSDKADALAGRFKEEIHALARLKFKA